MKNRSAFTLIEMLLVVSLIVLLIALLLPALGNARETTKRAVCASNLSQCGAALSAYGVDNGGEMPVAPDVATQAHVFRFVSQNYDLRKQIKGHLAGFGVWTCPSVDAPPIDAVANTRTTSYSPYRLYSGRESPTFGTVAPVTNRINSKYASSRQPLMQDATALIVTQRPWVPVAGGGQPSGAIFNHGKGQLLTFDATNPSWRFRYHDNRSALDGANILFLDNAVSWEPNERLVVVGPWNSSDSGLDLSLMP